MEDVEGAPKVQAEPRDEAVAGVPARDARLGVAVHVAVGEAGLPQIAGVGDGHPFDLVAPQPLVRPRAY